MVFRNNTRKLVVEELEPRWVPAGNVTGEVVGGVLYLTGDNAANAFRVVYEDHSHVQIEGLDGTLINGQPTATFHDPVNQPFSGVQVQTGNGNDSVVAELKADGIWMDIFTGHGHDRVTALVAGQQQSNLHIETGDGNDEVVFQAMEGLPIPPTLGGFYVSTDRGDDVVRFVGSLNVYRDIGFIYLGSGDDTLAFDAAGSMGENSDFQLWTDGGSGNDTLLNPSYFSDLYLPVGVIGFESIEP